MAEQAMIERIAELERVLAKCADKFGFYEQCHRLKCTADGDEKADRNREMADMCREYLASNRGYDVLDNVTPLGIVASADTHAERHDPEEGHGPKDG